MLKLKTMLTVFTVAAAAAAAVPAIAASTRSAQAVPAKKVAQTAPKPDVGPKNGFPDTPGLARAMQVASANAAFNRNNSPGG